MKFIKLALENDYRVTEQSFGYEDDEGNGVSWIVSDIIKHVKNLKPVQLKVDLFKVFLEYKIKTYDQEDWERVKAASFDYPIIVGAGTFTFTDDKTKGRYPIIIDGVHRLVKALQSQRRLIDAVVTDTLPPPEVTGKGLQLDGIKYKM